MNGLPPLTPPFLNKWTLQQLEIEPEFLQLGLLEGNLVSLMTARDRTRSLGPPDPGGSDLLQSPILSHLPEPAG
jgi:hypothetical protein